MATHPEFPDFKPVQIEDQDVIRDILWEYQAETSEWTFTNLFIWRSHYGFQWSVYSDWLFVICAQDAHDVYALQPVGPASRAEAMRVLLEWLEERNDRKKPQVERADVRLVSEIGERMDSSGERSLQVQPTRDQFDYVYRSEDLIKLAGGKYHAKRNHINKFLGKYSFEYGDMNEEYVKSCLELAEKWCRLSRCEEDMNLMGEWEAILEALRHFSALRIEGGVILVENEVKAFALGELLNKDAAVIHVEKADLEIPELYAVINQQFCERGWRNVSYINREQDLGEPGLRKAKLAYYPDHLMEKSVIRQA